MVHPDVKTEKNPKPVKPSIS